MIQHTDINKDTLPQHVAIIMDGNGRWAKKQSKIRIFGHKVGVKAVVCLGKRILMGLCHPEERKDKQ